VVLPYVTKQLEQRMRLAYAHARHYERRTWTVLKKKSTALGGFFFFFGCQVDEQILDENGWKRRYWRQYGHDLERQREVRMSVSIRYERRYERKRRERLGLSVSGYEV
jgi:hypothetical protein